MSLAISARYVPERRSIEAASLLLRRSKMDDAATVLVKELPTTTAQIHNDTVR